MKNRLALVPVIFLASGVVLTVAGLAIMVARGAEAPVAALALLAVGLLDGVTGVVWTMVALFSRRDEAPAGPGVPGASRGRPPAPARAQAPGPGLQSRVEETQRTLVLASGLLAVIFLGAVLALLLYLHVIVGCMRSWGLL
jgi:hypothetical protein